MKVAEILIGFVMMISLIFDRSIYIVDYMVCEIFQISGSIVLYLVFIYMSEYFILFINSICLNITFFSVVYLYFLLIVFAYLLQCRNECSLGPKSFYSPNKSQNQMLTHSAQAWNHLNKKMKRKINKRLKCKQK